MSQKIIKGTKRLSETIRSRRLELGLTIEEAAFKAGIGTKTWCRYESGASIRKDKAKGVCKALNWIMLPDIEGEEGNVGFDIGEYMRSEAWSEYIRENFGEAAALSFVIGSDILLDELNEDLRELSTMPRGTHIGQLPVSMLREYLPEQFLMRYDYDFLYCLRVAIEQLRRRGGYGSSIVANSVIQEIALYLIIEKARFLMESMSLEMSESGVEGLDFWEEWIYDLFGDMDIVTWLYSNKYLAVDHTYHFEHWLENQFYE